MISPSLLFMLQAVAMVSYSSSSLSVSRTSHASSSSSRSSPPSSPDSATNISVTPQNHSVSPPCRRISPPLSTRPAIVPFSWEEKPGVLKKEIMQTGHLDGHKYAGNSSYDAAHDHKLNSHTPVAGAGIYENLESSLKHVDARTSTGKYLPQIRPPPCLLHPGELHPNAVEGGELTNYHGASAAAVGSRIMASFSFHKRRHHRNTPSLEDDPFWLAMVACTNEGDKGAAIRRRKGSKEILAHEGSRTDSSLARRVLQDSVYFEQCIPRQGGLETRSTSRKVYSGERQEKALDQARYDDKEPLNSVKSSSRKVHNTHSDAAHHRHCNREESEYYTQSSARPACKAFKALSMARTETRARCKKLWQQQGPPVVDISCGSRQARSKGGADAALKHKRSDLFGCKSDHSPIVLSSRFA